jgi:hypothetical protein
MPMKLAAVETVDALALVSRAFSVSFDFSCCSTDAN